MKKSELLKRVKRSLKEKELKIKESDQEPSREKLNTGDCLHIKKRERHRLIGLNGWGVVAEIWQHDVPGNPSDENDIVRLDDFLGR